MRAVVLAAGNGSRLRDITGGGPKPLAPLQGRPIIAHVLEALRDGGADDIVVVSGYEADEVERAAARVRPSEARLSFVENAFWTRGNATSLWAARTAVGDDGFVLAMADHLVDPEIVRLVAAGDADRCRLAIERSDPADSRSGEATRVRVRDGRVVDIGKRIDDWNALDTGLFWCCRRVFDVMTPELRAGEAGDVFAALARSGELDAVDVSGRMWIDIDTMEDLQRAEQLLGSRHGRSA